MVGTKKLGKMDEILRLAKQEPSIVMGGIHFILTGDFYQLPPPLDKSLYKVSSTKNTDLDTCGREVYQSTSCFVELNKSFRFKTKELSELNERIRTATFQDGDESHFKIVKGLSLDTIQSIASDAIYIATTQAIRDEINTLAINQISSLENPVINLWAQHHIAQKKKIKKSKKKSQQDIENNDSQDVEYVSNEDLNKAIDLPPKARLDLLSLDKAKNNPDIKLKAHLSIYIGTRVLLLKNEDPKIGLFNGAMGTVEKIYYLDKDDDPEKIPKFAQGPFNPYCTDINEAAFYQFQLPVVLVRFDSQYYSSTLPGFNNENGLVPIVPQTKSFSYMNENGKSTIYRTQLPLINSACITAHKGQSLSLDNIVFINEKIFCSGIVYSAISRARSIEGITIVERDENNKFNKNVVNKFNLIEIHDEYKRLRDSQRLESRRIATSFQVTNNISANDLDTFDDIPIINKIIVQPVSKKKYSNKKISNDLNSPNYNTSLKRNISNLFNSMGTEDNANSNKRPKFNQLLTNQTNNNPLPSNLRTGEFWYLDESDRIFVRNKMVELGNLPTSDSRVSNYWRNPYTRMYIDRSDLCTLLNKNWLNSYIIDAFLAGFHRQYDTSGRYKLLNCYFFTFLNKENKTEEEQRTFLKITANWTVDDLNKDIIFPIHRPEHWLLCVISKENKCISIIDPLYGDSYEEYYQTIKKWYHTLQIKLFGDTQPAVNWKKKLHRNYSMAKQTDGSSCGPLACLTAAHYISSGEFPTSSRNFSQDDVPNIRLYMLWMILKFRDIEFSSVTVIEDDDDLIEIIKQISQSEHQVDTNKSNLNVNLQEDNSSI